MTELASGYPIVSFVDIKEPYNPMLIHAFETSQFGVHSIFVKENLMFPGNGSNGLYIYDISDFYKPVLIIVLPDVDPDDMVVRDNFIYLIDGYYLGVFDISVITEPEMLCWIGDYSISRNAIDIQGSFAYIAGKTVDIFNISNPTNPDQISSIEIVSGWLYDVCISDNNCFILSEDGPFMLNIENPGNPAVMDEYIYKSSYLDFQDEILIVSKDYDSPIGIGFFNVSGSQQIELILEYFSDKAKDVYLHDDFAKQNNKFNKANPRRIIIGPAIDWIPSSGANLCQYYDSAEL